MDELKEQMEKLGFSDKEAAVYVALLQLGKCRVNKISDKAGVNRATCYGVLKTLEEKGLIIVVKRGTEKLFVAESPERIVTLFKMKVEKAEEQSRVAEELVARLRAYHQTDGSKPKIRYIETVDGLVAMHREAEERGEDILQIVGYDSLIKLMDGRITKKHRDELEKKPLKVRSILVTDKLGEIPTVEGSDVIRVSKDLFDVGGEMSVMGDRLILCSYTDNIIAIEITSKAIADTARATLELAWREAERLGGGG